MKGVYGYAVLNRRINEKALPKTSIIDLKDRRLMLPGDRVFSKILIEAIKDRLAKKEQVILLDQPQGL